MFARLHLRRSTITALLVALAMIATMSTAFAKNGPPPGKGPGGGETTVANNLSVPTMFVGSVGFGLPDAALDGDPTTLVEPSGTATTNWPIDPAAYYYVQGENTWRAQYEKVSAVAVTGDWGDNLTGEASLKAGHPVRVEMGLTANTTQTLLGYSVVKLEPSVEDRNSHYGTLADSASGPAHPAAMTPRVWTTGAYLTISGSATQFSLPGEINATGAPVFGYNWRPAAAGDYTLTFHVPSTSGVTISNSNTGDQYSISIDVTVTGGGGSGGGGGQGGPPNR